MSECICASGREVPHRNCPVHNKKSSLTHAREVEADARAHGYFEVADVIAGLLAERDERDTALRETRVERMLDAQVDFERRKHELEVPRYSEYEGDLG